jgi:hypothetical protein
MPRQSVDMAAPPPGRRRAAKSYWCRREPKLLEILSEPIVRDLMAADRVEPEAMVALLHRVRQAMLKRKP